MTRFSVRLIFLTLTFLLSGFLQTFANSAQSTANSFGHAGVEKSSDTGDPSDAESIDLPSSSHGSGKDLGLPLAERAEEQEVEFKSFKKKIDRTNNTSSLSDALYIASLFINNNKLSSLQWQEPSVTANPKYLIFRNFRS